MSHRIRSGPALSPLPTRDLRGPTRHDRRGREGEAGDTGSATVLTVPQTRKALVEGSIKR
jgi:hypothetical protein